MSGRRAALVIGIDGYDSFAPLNGCVNDARSVKAVLDRNDDQSLNFEVKLLVSGMIEDTSAAAIRTALEDLFRNKDIDTALFFFAGHGYLVGGNQGHLCTSDGILGLPGIALNQILGLANASPAPNKFVILDCCHAGSIRELVSWGVMRR